MLTSRREFLKISGIGLGYIECLFVMEEEPYVRSLHGS